MGIAEVTQERVYVIAELGACHNGSMATACEMIDAAADAGADAVKLQRRCLTPGVLFTRAELDRAYANPNSFGATYGEHRAALELPMDDLNALADYARDAGMDCGISTWDTVSAAECATVGRFDFLKVPSACVRSKALVECVLGMDMPVLISIGMCEDTDVANLLDWVMDSDAPWVGMLQCTSAYPCPFHAMNLNVIDAMRHASLPVDAVGLSGHHLGIAVDIGAIAKGATVLERHTTLDRTMRGTDHAAALEPQGLTKLVRDIRAFESACGDGMKRVEECERPAMEKLRTEALSG